MSFKAATTPARTTDAVPWDNKALTIRTQQSSRCMCQPLCNLVPEYHRWKQDELCHILQATQKHCGLQNLQTAENQFKQSDTKIGWAQKS